MSFLKIFFGAPQSGGTNYTLTAESGSYALSGQAANLRVAYTLPAAHRAFALSGQAATLAAGYRTAAEYATFALAGQAATLRMDYAIGAAQGSGALAGQAAGLLAGYQLASEWGDLVLTGQAAAFVTGYTLGAERALFDLTGQDAGLSGAFSLLAETGAFAETGNAAFLLAGYLVGAATGTYAVSGSDAGLQIGYLTGAEAGSFALGGQDAVFLLAYRLLAAQGGFVMTGQAAALQHAGAIFAEYAAHAVAGQDAGLLAGYQLAAAHGVFTLAGQDADFPGDQGFMADVGLFTLSGQPATITYSGSTPAVVGGSAARRRRRARSDFQPWDLPSENPLAPKPQPPAPPPLVHVSLPAATGSYALRAMPARFRFASRVTAGPARYRWAGGDAFLPVNPGLERLMLAAYSLLEEPADWMEQVAKAAAAQGVTITMSDVDPRAEAWAAFDAKAQREESRYAAAAVALLTRERADVVRRVRDSLPQFKAHGDPHPSVADPYIEAALIRIAADYAPGGAYHAAWLARYRALIGATVRLGAGDVRGDVGLSFSLQNPRAQAAIQRRVTRLAGHVTETTLQRIRDVIATARAEGLGITEVAARIRDQAFDGAITRTRALTIARTETVGALNEGRWLGATQDGVMQAKRWLSQRDARVRDSHEAAEAAGWLAMPDRFPNGLLYPHEPGAPAAEVVNCRCTLLYTDQSPAEANRGSP